MQIAKKQTNVNLETIQWLSGYKAGSESIIVTYRRVRETTVAVEKQ